MSNKDLENFYQNRIQNIEKNSNNESLKSLSLNWVDASMSSNYVYNFDWMGRPIIQYPQDIVATQELIWNIKPDLIIETGIAHGGSLVLSASMLALLDMADAIKDSVTINPSKSKRKVIGIDIDIRTHNRDFIESHPMASRIQMIEGSSIDRNVIEKVTEISKGYNNVLVLLDSMHTHDHVLSELKAYASLVSIGSYCIVFDTFVEDVRDDMFPNRPWGVGNNPKTAVWEFLKENDDFIIDKNIENKLLITVAPDGYLKRVK